MKKPKITVHRTNGYYWYKSELVDKVYGPLRAIEPILYILSLLFYLEKDETNTIYLNKTQYD